MKDLDPLITMAERITSRLTQATQKLVEQVSGYPAGGSGGEAVVAAEAKACDVLVTGEIRLHAALDAMAAGVAVLAVGHHASERFALEQLAVVLAKAMPLIETKASDRDTDPFSWHAAFS